MLIPDVAQRLVAHQHFAHHALRLDSMGIHFKAAKIDIDKQRARHDKEFNLQN